MGFARGHRVRGPGTRERRGRPCGHGQGGRRTGLSRHLHQSLPARRCRRRPRRGGPRRRGTGAGARPRHAAPGAAAAGRGPAAAPATPDRSGWYASPYKVFDNLYWLGTRQHSSWALRTSEGLIIIDTNFAWATQPEIIDGLTTLGLDPRDIKYVIISHAHGDHDQGAAELQRRYGAKVVMGAPDWDSTLQRPATAAGGVPKRDIAVGPEGTKITLGDTTVTIVSTPGHTPGTLSYVFPVKDQGRTVMVAYSGGTLTGAFGTDGARWDEYVASQRKIAKAAADAGATVILSNHSEYDGAYTKARLVPLKREIGENHPFIVGADGVQRYFTVMAECALAVEAAARGEVAAPVPLNRLSRREFARLSIAGAVASPFVLDPAVLGAAAPTAQEVVDRIRKTLGVPWKADTVESSGSRRILGADIARKRSRPGACALKNRGRPDDRQTNVSPAHGRRDVCARIACPRANRRTGGWHVFDENLREWKDDHNYHPHGRGLHMKWLQRDVVRRGAPDDPGARASALRQ